MGSLLCRVSTGEVPDGVSMALQKGWLSSVLNESFNRLD